MRDRIEYGRLANPLPYPVQSGYQRRLRLTDVPALRLGDDRIEVLVLPELGGRVWSLRDRTAGRDLIFTNPNLIFANLALTGAWFAGGIEWNLGSTGHAATTCRPVFAGVVETDRGPLLRLWEWERTRDLVFQVDLMVPEGAPVLLAFVRVRNPDGVPEAPVLVDQSRRRGAPGCSGAGAGDPGVADRVRRFADVGGRAVSGLRRHRRE